MNLIYDLICGMNLDGFSDLVKFSHKDKVFYFCGNECAERFKKNPEKFQKEPLIRLVGVKKAFKLGGTETFALRGLDLHIWEGDFVSIIGASGSGKSTALNMIGLLDRPSSGKIFIKGKDAATLGDEERARLRSETFGFVFQQYNLIPWLNAFENVTLPMIFAKKDFNRDKVEALFKEIGLNDRLIHRPAELSGGEQQRTAILRALVNNPEIILGDEPTGNLDSATGNKILEMLVKLNKKEGKTLIIVTHDADIAEMADQVVAMRDGRLIRDHHVQKKIYTE